MRRARDDGGSVTLWLLGLCVVLLFVGGLSLDLWRAFSERRALASAVDAAAVAGASGVEEGGFRTGAALRLDTELAERRAWSMLRAQTDTWALTSASVSATPDAVTVSASGRVELTLLRTLLPDAAPLEIRVTSSSQPRGAD